MDTLVLVEVCSALMGAIVAVAMCRREEYSNVGHRLAWAWGTSRCECDATDVTRRICIVCLSQARQHPQSSQPCLCLPARRVLLSRSAARKCQAPSGRHESIRSQVNWGNSSLESVCLYCLSFPLLSGQSKHEVPPDRDSLLAATHSFGRKERLNRQVQRLPIATAVGRSSPQARRQ
jgi:hypothetical protein